MHQSANRFITRPLYLQLRDRLVKNIALGVWAQGAMIPNEIALAGEFDVSLGTMRKALARLESEGLVERRQGRGTRVVDHAGDGDAAHAPGLHDSSGNRIFGEIISTTIETGLASAKEARTLGLGKALAVTRLRRRRSWEGKPLAIDDIILSQRRFPGIGEEDVIRFRVAEFARRHGILLGAARADISPLVAGHETSDSLAVVAGTPLLHVQKLFLDVNREPVMTMESLYAPGPFVYGLGPRATAP